MLCGSVTDNRTAGSNDGIEKQQKGSNMEHTTKMN